VADSISDQREARDKLLAIRDLLPKPPKPPAERIRELVEREQAVRRGIDNVSEMPEGRREAQESLAESQANDGREAEDIANELAGSQEENHKAAAEKTQEASQRIFSSGELLRRDQPDGARGATDRAIDDLKEALALLTDQNQGDQQQDQQQQNQQQQDQQQQGQQDQSEEQTGQGYKLTPRQARLEMEDMDRRRRQEEARIYPGPSSISVSKDW
jgi:hypothetical protein